MQPSKKTHIYKIVLLYIIIGSLWILLSDFVSHYLVEHGFYFKYMQTVKGIGYILVTGILLYFLLFHDFKIIQAAWQKLAASEKRYRIAFEKHPHPLWEVDLSELKAFIETQSSSALLSLQEQVKYNSELREQCFSKIRTVDISKAVHELLGASYHDMSEPPCAKIFFDEEYTFLRKELEALAEQKVEFEIQQYIAPVGLGKDLALSIHWMVLPGHEEKYDRVLISAFDITHLDAMIKKLAASESKYRRLVENTNEAVLVVKSESIVFANNKARELFGVTIQELNKKALSEIIYSDDITVFSDSLSQCETQQKIIERTCRIVDQKGNIHWVICKYSITPWEESAAILVLLFDVTEKIIKENQLRQAKLLLEKVFNSLNEAVFVIDSNNRKVVICNLAAEKIFGYRQEEMNGRSTRQLHIDENTFAKFGEVSEDTMERGEAFTTTYTMRHKDGHEIITKNTVTPIDDAADWTHGVISVVRDVTVQKRFEQELKASETKYRRLLEDAKEGIVVIQNTFIAYINRQMEQVLGYEKEKLLGSAYLKYVHADDQYEVRDLYQKVISGEMFPPDKEIRVLDNKNIIHWLRVNAVKVEWDHEPAVMALVMDISEHKSLKRKTKEMEDRILQAQKMESIGTLAGGIAHDFNNILSAILGFTELALKEAEQNISLKRDLEEVYSAGVRAKELVKQILTFSRQTDSELQPLQVSPIIKEVIKFLRSSIPTSIVIKSDIHAKSLIKGDPTQIHQVLMNLCTNAVQAMKGEKGIVQVSVNDIVIEAEDKIFPELPVGNYIKVQVSDDGGGIAPEHIDQIFDPYFTTKEIGEGTGLGLSVVYGIIENYGGKITVQSIPGEGTIFTVLFPTVGDERRWITEENAEIPRGSERILVVDDETSLVRALEQQLVDLGYVVTSKTSSIEALEMYRSRPSDFDLVLTDMTMPNMTGDELAAEISSLCPDIPIIICTGFSRKTLDWNPANLPVDEVLYKPVATADLARVIRKLLDKKGRKERVA